MGAPDVFVRFGVPLDTAKGHLVWRADKPPHVMRELGSKSTAREDADDKQARDERMGVQEYGPVDPVGAFHAPRLRWDSGEACRHLKWTRR